MPVIRKRRRRLWPSGHPCARARRRRGRPRSSSTAPCSGHAADVVRDTGQGVYETVRRLVHCWASTRQPSGCELDGRATDISMLVRRRLDVRPEQLGESRAQATRRSTTGLPAGESQPSDSIGRLRTPVERWRHTTLHDRLAGRGESAGRFGRRLRAPVERAADADGAVFGPRASGSGRRVCKASLQRGLSRADTRT